MAIFRKIYTNRYLVNNFLLPSPLRIVVSDQIRCNNFSRLVTSNLSLIDVLPNPGIHSKDFFNKILDNRYTSNLVLQRIYYRLGRCSTSKILTKPSKKNQRCRNVQPSERSTSSLQFRTGKLKEAKNKVVAKVEELKENVITIPNALCVLRIAATPVLGYLVLQELYTASFGLFLIAGCTDVVDGYIARTFPGQQSMIGSFLDPAADKLLAATLFLTLTANGLIPVPLTSMIILRDVCLFGAGFYIRYVSLPPPKTLTRYFDVSFATARLRPTTISKVNTVIQLSLVACSLAAPVFGFVDHFLLHVLWYVTGTTTVLSAASYLYYKNTYKLLFPNGKQKIDPKGS